ncbi:leucine-rich repeat neuronal protein 4 isoform X2 [Gadus morhua]|uniref:Leucine-rich repeat neuronal protein 4-like n=1 Tax=Gadus morhua TaxID=8049 RepID=A0A8C4ZZ86_GADMO|nr:leucine-rich repeat neuronal protein 4-like isoform X2 [Gadus morhua]
MDSRRVTCCWAWALCILWIAAADRPLSVPIAKVFTGMADRLTFTPEPHSTAHTVVGSRVFESAPGAPAFYTTESASIPAGASVASTVSAKGPTAPPGRVVPSEAPLALSTPPYTLSPRPMGTTMIQQPASPSPTQGPTSREEITPSAYGPPATPSRSSTLLTPRNSSSSPPPAGERSQQEPAVEPSTGPQTAPAPLCDYDQCVHLQRPCPELQQLRGWPCRCPAQSNAAPAGTPGPVVALEVTRAWPTSASVRWCAPDSPLSAFRVWVLRGDGSAVSNGSVGPRTRQTDVFGLSAGGRAYRVCVSAQSAAGALSHARCVSVATPVDAGAVAAHVLSGACGVLLLAAVVLSLCLYRQCQRRRGEASRAEPTTHLLPAAHAFQDQRPLCSMVSIANPAYTPASEQRAPAADQGAHRAPAKKSANAR